MAYKPRGGRPAVLRLGPLSKVAGEEDVLWDHRDLFTSSQDYSPSALDLGPQRRPAEELTWNSQPSADSSSSLFR